jgi:hypothetical protein
MKATEREALEKAEKLLSTIEKHPLTTKIREDEAAAILTTRQEAAGKIETLRKVQVDSLSKLQAVEKKKEKKLKEAKASMETALNELRTAQAALFRENSDFHSAIGIHERVLLDTYCPEIDEAIQFFRDKLDYLRSPGRINKVGRKDENNLILWKKKTLSESNIQAIHLAIGYCQNAITELEKTKLIPELNLQKIQGLKDGIPSIDIYTESQGTKPMERQAPTIVPPCEYTLGKLIEKVNKHLKTPTPKARI